MKRVTSTSRTESEFLEALARVKGGIPKNAQLQRQAKLGRLRVTVASVALEAGRSRTLIGHDGCPYPAARAAVLDAMKPVAQPRSSAEVIAILRQSNAELRLALRQRDSAMAATLRKHNQQIEGLKRSHRDAKRSGKMSLSVNSPKNVTKLPSEA